MSLCESSQQSRNKQEHTLTQGKVTGSIIHLRCSLGLTCSRLVISRGDLFILTNFKATVLQKERTLCTRPRGCSSSLIRIPLRLEIRTHPGEKRISGCSPHLEAVCAVCCRSTMTVSSLSNMLFKEFKGNQHLVRVKYILCDVSFNEQRGSD